jgi:predicted enzyme related to lactoylglutathione lyase
MANQPTIPPAGAAPETERGQDFYKKVFDWGIKKMMSNCTVLVDDLEKTAAAVKRNGGEIIGEKIELKGLGFFACAADIDGKIFGIMQRTEWQFDYRPE